MSAENVAERSGAAPTAAKPTLDVDLLMAFAAKAEARFGLQRLSVWLNQNGDIRLDHLIVPKGERKKGRGSAAMERLCRLSDAYGRRVVLTPAHRGDLDGTTSYARLVRFYRRFGFVENSGRARDFMIAERMIRPAAAIAAAPPLSESGGAAPRMA
jgi:hypothetical protein